MTTTRTTADNPFAAHSLSVLRAFTDGLMGEGPFTRAGAVWGTVDQAREELAYRRAARAARRTPSP